MRIARVGSVAALLVALFTVSSATARAATSPLGTTITIGSPVLAQSRVLLDVPVDVSCSSSVFATVSFQNVFVEVRQASSQRIATGMGFAAGLLFPCDDSTHTVTVRIQADTAPFHGGLASVTARVHVEGTDAFGAFQFDNVTEGPRTVRISGGCVFTGGC